jgi:membrane protease YdiL (CAAX protease family)
VRHEQHRFKRRLTSNGTAEPSAHATGSCLARGSFGALDQLKKPVPLVEKETQVRDLEAEPSWAIAELLLAVALIAAGLKLPLIVFMLGSAPWLMAIGLLLTAWRGPGLKAIGLGAPASIPRTIAGGILVGIASQFVGTFVIEPLLARLTSGQLPDVTQFRSLVGNEMRLVSWIAISWSLAAVVEEVAYRGWILTRFAEMGRYSNGAWVSGLMASSALFGLVHAYQGVSGILANGLTGLVFGGVYLATGRNLWAAIVAHGALDTAGFAMMYLGVYPGL